MLAERKLQKVKITLMRHPKFALLQGILMLGKTSVAEDIPTAVTNGRDEIYGREFVDALSNKELAFVVAHEASHKMYRHLTIWKKLHGENHHLANAACDYVINIMLKDLDPEEAVIAIPRFKGKEIGLCDPRFRGMNAKQVFDILKNEQNQNKGEGEGEGEGGIDSHDWESANKMTDKEKQELARDIDQAIRQGLIAEQKSKGSSSGGLSRELQDLLTPKVNWREALREYVKSVCSTKDTSSWRRANRRFLSSGIYMPSLIGEKVGHLVIGIDTSGSIGAAELSEFLTEVKGIAEEVHPEQVDLLYWDSRVAAHETYSGNDVSNIVSSTKPKGGGGTAPNCVSKYLIDNDVKPECVIMLTDGYVSNDWGDNWQAPVMWVISSGDKSIAANNGKTIYLDG